ncbi:hypothetical protein M3Y96_01004400 [Aphelenchoides besseyi]|nr:hypothetical protein M3Y96_01004400 [Aphelenchoides besseyi]
MILKLLLKFQLSKCKSKLNFNLHNFFLMMSGRFHFCLLAFVVVVNIMVATSLKGVNKRQNHDTTCSDSKCGFGRECQSAGKGRQSTCSYTKAAIVGITVFFLFLVIFIPLIVILVFYCVGIIFEVMWIHNFFDEMVDKCAGCWAWCRCRRYQLAKPPRTLHTRHKRQVDRYLEKQHEKVIKQEGQSFRPNRRVYPVRAAKFVHSTTAQLPKVGGMKETQFTLLVKTPVQQTKQNKVAPEAMKKDSDLQVEVTQNDSVVAVEVKVQVPVTEVLPQTSQQKPSNSKSKPKQKHPTTSEAVFDSQEQ